MSKGNGQAAKAPLVSLDLSFDGGHPDPDRFKHDYSCPERPDPNSHAPKNPDKNTVGGLISEGNRRYAAFIRDCKAAASHGQCSVQENHHRVFLTEHEVGSDPDHQTPYAAVFSCIDSRVPAELVTGQSANDMFAVRTAGNVLLPVIETTKVGKPAPNSAGGEARSSLEYILLNYSVGAPTGHKTLSAVLVLGHTKCGAIAAAYDVVTKPEPAPTPSLAALVEALRPRVEMVVKKYPKETPDRQKDIISHVNSVLTAFELKALASRLGVDTDLGIFFGTYHVSNFAIVATDLPGHRPQRVPELLAQKRMAKKMTDMAEALTWREGAARPEVTSVLDRGLRQAILEDAFEFAQLGDQ
jgi:carbonic anhydrase